MNQRWRQETSDRGADASDEGANYFGKRKLYKADVDSTLNFGAREILYYKSDWINEVMLKRRLRWFGHAERRDDTNWLKRIRKLEVNGMNGHGRPRKTWEQVIKEDLRVKGLRNEAAQNRAEWRSAIA